MFPHLFRTDLGFVYTFTVVWIVGLILASWMIVRQSPRFKGWDGLLVATIFALAGGRMQYVWENSEWFIENPAMRWSWQQGGHGYGGAILGALLGLLIWSALTNSSFAAHVSYLTPAVPLLHLAGWVACYFDGCGYGATSFISWATAELPDNFGLMAVRYQTQLLGIIFALLIGIPFWIPILGRNSNPAPSSTLSFWSVLLIFASLRAIITNWQGSTVPILFGFRSDMVLAFAVTAVALTGLILTIILNGRANLGTPKQMG